MNEKKHQFKLGDRVEAVKENDYKIGDIGTISLAGSNYVNVDWDNGHTGCFVSYFENIKHIKMKEDETN